MNALKLILLAGAVVKWFARATADGKVTVKELAELAELVARGFGIQTTFKIAGSPKVVSTRGQSPVRQQQALERMGVKTE